MAGADSDGQAVSGQRQARLSSCKGRAGWDTADRRAPTQGHKAQSDKGQRSEGSVRAQDGWQCQPGTLSFGSISSSEARSTAHSGT